MPTHQPKKQKHHTTHQHSTHPRQTQTTQQTPTQHTHTYTHTYSRTQLLNQNPNTNKHRQQITASEEHKIIRTTKLRNWQISKYNNIKHNRKKHKPNKIETTYRHKFKNLTQPKSGGTSSRKLPWTGGGPEVITSPEQGRFDRRDQRSATSVKTTEWRGQRPFLHSGNASSEQTHSDEEERKKAQNKNNDSNKNHNNTNTNTHNQSNNQTLQGTHQTQDKDKNITDTEESTGRHLNHADNELTFLGRAGQPRELAPCGDQKARVTPNPNTRPRNTKRGIRNQITIELRRERRTHKRRLARNKHKQLGKGNIIKQRKKNHTATAQEPTSKFKFSKIKLGRHLRIATLNIRGVKKPGVREEVEKWMKEKDIDILTLTETRNNQNSKESRKQYTWFFSGEGGREEYTAGVGIVINNKLIQYLEDAEPITDRLAYITLRGPLNINIAVTYTPTADRPTEEKEKTYADIQKIIDRKKSKGPLFITGDLNARLIYPTNLEEEHIMGKHTMHKNEEKVNQLRDEMRENRDLLTELCITNELRVTNTMYRKPLHKIATYRIKKEITTETEHIAENTHEQIDYIITTRRWRNAITNVETDTKANINTDHYPVIADVTVRLRKQEHKGTARKRYKECSIEQKENKQNIRRRNRTTYNNRQ